MNGFNSQNYKRFFANEFTIVDKKRREVPFLLNPAQDDFITRLTPLNNVLKNRKQGISSVSLGIAVKKFILGENERCASLSFVDASAHQQLARADHFLKSYQRINGIEIPMKYNNRNEWVFESTGKYGKYYTNTLRVGSAQSQSFGRGDDITFLHITEAAFAKDLYALLAAIGEAVTDGAITILETTANGYDQFKQHWDDTERGKNSYTNFFYDPFWTYTREFVEEKRRNLGRLGAQEYPYTPQEAFLTSGLPYLDQEGMMRYMKQVENLEPINV